MGDSHVGLQARLMSQALRKMTGALNNSGTTMIFINQLREKIGVMFGSPETTTGGRALKFYSSVRLDVRRIETLKDGQEMVGNRTRIKVVKNKVAPPFKQAEFDIMYGQGISREGGLIDVGVEAGLVRKAGAWYTYEGDQLGQGKENARNFLRDNPDLANELEKKILEKLGVGPQVTDEAPAPRASRSTSTSEPMRGHAAAYDDRDPSATASGGREGLGPEADHEAVARKILLDQLTGQARSRAELATKLARKQVPDGGRRAAARPVRGGRPRRRRGLRPRLGPVAAAPAAAWPAVPWRSSCAARASTQEVVVEAVDGRRRRTTRPRRRGSSCGASCRSLERFDDGDRGAPADRDAGPQGLPVRASPSAWSVRRSPSAAELLDESP